MGTLRSPISALCPPPSEDCQRLKKAFQGWGTDEKEIIRILGQRNAEERRKIRDTYQQLFNKPLIDDLASELSGDFGKAVILWTRDPPERDAILANTALKSRKNSIHELQIIVEIACATNPQYLFDVKKAYCSIFDCSLEEDIVSHVPLPVRKVLLGLVSTYRHDREVVDLNTADAEAEKLHDFIETKRLDHDEFLLTLTTRNVYQLRTTFQCYKQKYGKSIQEDIGGNSILESVLKVAIWCLESPEKHFAEVLRASMAGLGTDEDSLTRAIVTRAEVDTISIKAEYLHENKISLDDAVVADTSGDYKDFLLTLLGHDI